MTAAHDAGAQGPAPIGLDNTNSGTRFYSRIISIKLDYRLGVSANKTFVMTSGYRNPCTSVEDTKSLTSCISCRVSLTFRAPRFSSKYWIFFVPGIGMMPWPWASNQASVNCPGVQPFLLAIAAMPSTSFKFFIEIVFGDAGRYLAEIAFFKVIRGSNLAGEQPTAKR